MVDIHLISKNFFTHEKYEELWIYVQLVTHQKFVGFVEKDVMMIA
jgi:hypothetical protein